MNPPVQSTPPPTAEIEAETLRARLDILWNQLPVALAGNFAVAPVTIAVLWSTVASSWLLGWLALTYLVAGVRTYLRSRYHRQRPNHNRFWYRTNFVAALISGITWGSAGILFFTPDQPLSLAFVVIILAGMTAGSLSAYGSIVPIYAAFSVPMMLPIALHCLLEGDTTFSMIGVACILFLLVNLKYSLNIQATLTKTIKLQFMNRDLAKRLEAANQQLHRFSYLDALTGIANRRQLDEYLDAAYVAAASNARPVTMILADVDHFKAYNDEYGHDQGDQVLRQVAESLKSGVRENDALVGRFGGEEFCIILQNSDRQTAIRVAERLRRRIQELRIPHAKSTSVPFVTASFGVATKQAAEQDAPNHLLQAADQALYQAKRAGRNCLMATPA